MVVALPGSILIITKVSELAFILSSLYCQLQEDKTTWASRMRSWHYMLAHNVIILISDFIVWCNVHSCGFYDCTA